MILREQLFSCHLGNGGKVKSLPESHCLNDHELNTFTSSAAIKCILKIKAFLKFSFTPSIFAGLFNGDAPNRSLEDEIDEHTPGIETSSSSRERQ